MLLALLLHKGNHAHFFDWHLSDLAQLGSYVLVGLALVGALAVAARVRRARFK